MRLPERWGGQGTWDILKQYLLGNFVQSNSTTDNPEVLIGGSVSSAGAKILGNGFSSAKVETGVYSITLDKPISLYAAIAMDIQGTQRTACGASISSTVVNFALSNGTGAKEDIAFSFFIMGIPL